MKRTILAVLVGLTVFGTVLGMAASLTVTPTDASGAAAAAVSSCDTDGLTTSFVPDVTTITELADVDVAGIDANCAGLTVYAKVGTTVVSGVVPVGGGTVTLDFSAGSITIASITAIDVVIASA